MKHVLLVVLCLTMMMGCIASRQRAMLPRVTAGEIGCPEDEITIVEEDVGMITATWTATCRGKTYYCSSTTETVSCKEAVDTQ